MTRPDTLRTLDRGLAIVEYLSRHSRSGLAELRRETGLSNATLLRLLGTLQARGWVRRNIVEGQYELSHALDAILGSASRAHPLAGIAEPVLLDLKARQAGLPSDLCAVIEAGRLEVIESTRLRGPMAPTRTGLGIRPSLVLSAHGRAALAFSDADTRDRHIARLRQFNRRDEVQWIDSGQLETELRATRARGFGLRAPQYWAEPFDPGPDLGAMAVPIQTPQGVYGTLSLLWMADDMDIDEVLGFGALQDLTRAASRIAAALAREGIAPPQV